MYCYILQLFNVDYKDDIILSMTSAGIKDTTVIEGKNLNSVLPSDFPVFKGLIPGDVSNEQVSLLFTGTVDKRETLISFFNVLTQAGIRNTESTIYKLMLIQGESIE